MKRLVLLLFVVTVSFSLLATPVSLKRAQELATTLLNSHSAVTRSEVHPAVLVWSGPSTRSLMSDVQRSPFYVFNLEGASGFVVIAGDDAAYPVLGYDLSRSFSAGNMPANVSGWFASYARQIEWIQENNIQPGKQVSVAWEKAAQGEFALNATSIVQLNTALWDQMTPYNELCPTVNGELTPTGCVATSTAIAMKYHQWPDVGQGSLSYQTSTYGLNLSANFDTAFDWQNMPAEYNAGAYTTQQAHNVAQLMYDCGVFSQMDYAPGNSGAITLNAAIGLVNYMKYDVSLQVLSRANYAFPEWNAMVQQELNIDRPVVYGGENDQNEGHQFILDGYNDQGYYHVNWGWSGLANGYYLLTVLEPEVQGTGGNIGGFSLDQDAMFSFKRPQSNSSYNDVVVLIATTYNNIDYKGLLSSTSTYVPNTPFTVTAGMVLNSSIRTFNGSLAMALVSQDGTVKQFISEPQTLSLEVQYGSVAQFPCTITLTPASTDRLQLMYQSSDATDWQWARGSSTAVGALYIDPSTGFSHPESPTQVTLSYNQEEIKVDSPDEIKSLEVFYLGGASVLYVEPNTTSCTLSSSVLPSGIYLLKIKTTNGEEVHKMIK